MNPAYKPLQAWKGNDFVQAFRFKAGPAKARMDLTGSTVLMFVTWPGGEISREMTLSSSAGDAVLDQASVSLTREEVRGFPLGRATRFEIERRIGDDQETLLYGELVVAEWANKD
ncbi:hypothetical protein [Salinarimonas soli]|uniref:Uncharacterized protein n=1 Tax=Salinarimonas soli TaxID=1638099 RepID=A0A5B2VA83_9HYPH|nr:hypothetical protein [Salinarimonas soli]KAA2235259.1 hypothetical protein F0L46_21185 [Salinarimonas soli]